MHDVLRNTAEFIRNAGQAALADKFEAAADAGQAHVQLTSEECEQLNRMTLPADVLSLIDDQCQSSL